MILKMFLLFLLGHSVNWLQVCAPKLPILKDYFWTTLVTLSVITGWVFLKGFTIGLESHTSFEVRIVSFVSGTIVYPVLGSIFLGEPLVNIKNLISVVLCVTIIMVQIKL
jgi:hypothetical protein